MEEVREGKEGFWNALPHLWMAFVSELCKILFVMSTEDTGTEEFLE